MTYTEAKMLVLEAVKVHICHDCGRRAVVDQNYYRCVCGAIRIFLVSASVTAKAKKLQANWTAELDQELVHDADDRAYEADQNTDDYYRDCL